MASYEQTIIIGNVGRVDDLRYLQNGTAVHSFSVAVSKRWKNSDGEYVERTNWYKVSTWRGLAEVTSKYVEKGMQIMVTGEPEAQAYLDKDGQPRASLNLTARDVQFLSKNHSGDGDSTPQSTPDNVTDIPF